MKPDRRGMFPPSLGARTAFRVPRRHRQDAAQEAWLAFVTGEDADMAVWSYVKKTERQEARCTCFSQLEEEQRDRIFQETFYKKSLKS